LRKKYQKVSKDVTINDAKVGNPQYDPRAMVKLPLYGYSYGIKSSRKLERECHYNMSFIWLMGGLKPDHKTIAEFRRKNKKALKKLLKLCAQVCIKLNLVAGNVLFVDGTKIKANASIMTKHIMKNSLKLWIVALMNFWMSAKLLMLRKRVAHLLWLCRKS